LRAAIVFDDPNLRWRSYGYIDYRELLEHADAHGYHAAMAMIPLDAGRPRTARRRRCSRAGATGSRSSSTATTTSTTSCCRRPIRTPRWPPPRRRSAAVVAFERRSGVRVDRVMMPPHGLCSQAMTRALGAVRLRRAVGDPPAAVDGREARGSAARGMAAGRVRGRQRG